MPIDGLTYNENRRSNVQRLGKLRKGAPKTPSAPGKELPYFRFASTDPQLEKMFVEIYGPSPAELPCFLPNPEPLKNFPHWCEVWDASGLVHRCDGKVMNLWRTKTTANGKPVTIYVTGQKACETHLHRDGNPMRDKVGRLEVILAVQKDDGRFIPAFGGQYVGTVTLETHGFHDLNQIIGTLESMPSTWQIDQATGELLYPIPFLLKRVKENVSIPGYGAREGERSRADKVMAYLTVHPAYRMDQFAQIFMGAPAAPALGTGKPMTPALPSPAPKVVPPPEQLNLAGVEVLDADLYEPPTFDTPPATAPEWMDAAIALWPGKWETVKSAVEKKDKDWPEFVTARNLELLDEMMNSKATTALESHVKAAWPGKEAFVKPVFDECTKVKVALDPIQYIAAIQKLTGTETPGDAVAKILADMTF